MPTVWFCLIAAMLSAYVVLDGFDLGAGILHFVVARDAAERRMVLRSIGPVWDGNEVWLIAAGGTLYFAFPALYASSFSGFYLPLMIVLWLLMFRGIALELRGHLESRVWRSFWDAAFSASSLLLALFFGAALGNVVRGVPLGASGWFFEPLWTNFRTSGSTGILDWYTILVGLLAVAALAGHGACWIALKTDGELCWRARRAAAPAWWAAAALTVLVTLATFAVQPHVAGRMAAHPWGLAFPAMALAGLIAAAWSARAGSDLKAFLASCVYLSGMMASAAFGVYPFVLPANSEAAFGWTAEGASAGAHGLVLGLAWWVPGMILAAVYLVILYNRFRGKVSLVEGRY